MHTNRREFIWLALLAVVVLLLSGRAAGSARFTPEKPAGFWQGLWHGAISLITFIINLLNHDVKVYEVNNNGGWYNFGFLSGVICVWGGGSGAGWKSSKRRKQAKKS